MVALLAALPVWSCASLPRDSSARTAHVKLDPDQLSPAHLALFQSTLDHLEPMIAEKKRDGTANLLIWKQLYQPLTPQERAFVEAFRALRAEPLGATSHFFGRPQTEPDLVPVGAQAIVKPDGPSTLDPQYLPRRVHQAYETMMEAMQQDLGTKLLVESGYRSHAYQLYLFLHYMPNHNYSIRETNRHVALPGYSEHGAPQRQAIDFINAQGINGEDHPEEFEALPEYTWLQTNAPRFGFFLSYPRGNTQNTAFEPWHWHFEAKN